MLARNRRFIPIDILVAIVLISFLLLAILPFAIMLLFSFTQKTTLTLKFDFSEFSLSNYEQLLLNSHFISYFKNSVIVVVGACFFNCVFGSMAAYGFAKKKFPGRDKIFWIYLATMMIPGQVVLIPVFLILKAMGLINTYWALMIPFVNAFGVFLIRQFMVNIPDDLIEAAKIDGCPDYLIFIKVIIPLIKPVLISLTIFTFRTCWNDYIWPLILCSEDKQTLTLGVALLKGKAMTNYGLVMCGATIAFLPPFILYIILQKQFVEGIALSGIKG